MKDSGTPELIMKRAFLSQGDPTLSTCPLDVIFARGIIDRDGRDTAAYWAALRKVVFGKAIPAASDLLQITSYGRPEEFDFNDAESKWRGMCRQISSLGPGHMDVIESIVIHEKWPRWLNAKGGPRHANRQKFEASIGALVAWKRQAKKLAAE